MNLPYFIPSHSAGGTFGDSPRFKASIAHFSVGILRVSKLTISAESISR